MTGSIERNMSPWSSRSKGTLCALAVLVSLAASCQEDRPGPTDPEGAYRLFMEAIEAKDEDAVWEYLDQGTKDLFAEQYKALVRIDRIIEAYFDPSEHRYMRERTGAYLLETEHIDSAKALYQFIFDVDDIVFEEDHEVGATIDEFNYSDEEETVAMILTRGGQSFVMVCQSRANDLPCDNKVKEEDKIWRTVSLRNMFEDAVAPIKNSESALKDFAKENLMDERQRRIEVVQYFQERLKGAPAQASTPAPPAETEEAPAPSDSPEAQRLEVGAP